MGLGDRRKDSVLLQQRLRKDKTVTVVSVMGQLARLQLKQDEGLHNYIIPAEDFSTKLEHAGEHLPERLLNAMVLNGSSERPRTLCGAGEFPSCRQLRWL